MVSQFVVCVGAYACDPGVHYCPHIAEHIVALTVGYRMVPAVWCRYCDISGTVPPLQQQNTLVLERIARPRALLYPFCVSYVSARKWLYPSGFDGRTQIGL